MYPLFRFGILAVLVNMSVRTIAGIAADFVVSLVPSPIRSFTGGLLGWALALLRFFYRATNLPPLHELVKICVVAAFFVGFTGGLEGSGAPPKRPLSEAPWDGRAASEDDSANRERAFAALSEAGREGWSFLRSQSGKLAQQAKHKFAQRRGQPQQSSAEPTPQEEPKESPQLDTDPRAQSENAPSHGPYGYGT
jgi:hypothetical protein